MSCCAGSGELILTGLSSVLILWHGNQRRASLELSKTQLQAKHTHIDKHTHHAPVCDDTQNLNETESENFSDTKLFRYRIRYFLAVT